MKAALIRHWWMGSTAVPLGSLFSDDFVRGSLGSNYTQVGATATFNITANQLVVAGGVNTLGQYIEYTNKLINVQEWVEPISIIVGTIDANSHGIPIGIQSVNAVGSLQVSVRLDSTNIGKIHWFYNNSITPFQATVTGASILAGDVLTCTLTRSFFAMTFSFTNSRTGLTFSDTYNYSQATSGLNFPPNAGYFSIYAMGGTHTVTSFSATSPTRKNAGAMMLSDSIGRGAYSTGTHGGWFDLACSELGLSYVNLSGGGNRIQDFNTTTIIELNPDKIYICLGTNNVPESVNTMVNRYLTLINPLLEAGWQLGVDLFFCKTTPRNDVSMVALNDAIAILYPNTIDMYTPILGSGFALNATYNSGDNLHPNEAGHRVLADAFKAFSAAAITVYHKSEFVGANGTLITSYTPEVGTAWSYQTACTMEIQNNALVAKTMAASTYAIAFTELNVTNYVIRAVIRCANVNDTTIFYFRHGDISNNCELVFLPTGSRRFYDVIAGSVTGTAGTVTPTLVVNTDYQIKIVVSGTAVTIFVDGVAAGSHTMVAGLNSFTKVGLSNGGTVGNGLTKSFYVSSL